MPPRISKHFPHVLTTLLSAFFLCSLVATPAKAIGLLVPTDRSLPPLKLLSHRVDVVVVERAAKTHVVQEFDNPTDRPLEATFLFPMPKGSTVEEFALWMNGKRETGKVIDKQQARQIYESIVRRVRDPGLIEYVDADLFQVSVFPIPAKGKQKIELTYSHVVDYQSGALRYSYPMKTSQAAVSTLEDFTFSMTVKSKSPISNLYSPTHRLATTIRGTEAVASFEKNAFSLAENFSVYWNVNAGDVGITVVSTKASGDEPGYFMLMASPNDAAREQEIIGKRVSFVIDTSGSMEGDKMKAVKQALTTCLGKLKDDDLFNIVTFGGYAEAMWPKMQSASSANVAKAKEYVGKIEPMGGTNIDEAMMTSLSTVSGSDKSPLFIVFLTDGRPTVGESDIGKLLSKIDGGIREKVKPENTRVFAFGVGDDVNTVLLDKLSDTHGGVPTYLAPDASIETEVTSFYERISYPVLSNISIDVGGADSFAVLPRRLPDLFKGSQLLLLGRYRKAGDVEIALRGIGPSGEKVYRQKVHFNDASEAASTESAFISRLWAQRQVGLLLDEIRTNGERPALIEEVKQLATRFGIVTPYTSYLVVEPGTNMDVSPIITMPPVRLRDDRSERGVLGGAGGAPSSATKSPAPMAAPVWLEEAEDAAKASAAPGDSDKRRPMAVEGKSGSKGREMLKKDSGADGVAAAKEINRMKNIEVDDGIRANTSERRALGRAFKLDSKEGRLVDERSKSSDTTLRIQAYSDAYFMVLRLRPDLKDALTLGESVAISVGNGRTLIIDPKGEEKIDEKKLQDFLKK